MMHKHTSVSKYLKGSPVWKSFTGTSMLSKSRVIGAEYNGGIVRIVSEVYVSLDLAELSQTTELV